MTAINPSITTKGIYDFENPFIRQTKISDNVWLRLGESGCSSLAVISFVDEREQKIQIPDLISVRDNTNDVIINPIGNTFPLCCTDNYSVRYKGDLLFSLKTQRRWAIIGPVGRIIETVAD